MLNTKLLVFTLNMSTTVISKRVKFSSVRHEKVIKNVDWSICLFHIGIIVNSLVAMVVVTITSNYFATNLCKLD